MRLATAMRSERVPLNKAYLLLNHGPVTLISSAHQGRRNVMAASWAMPLDFDPPKIAVVIDTRAVSGPFNIENGAQQIAPFFANVEYRFYQDSLHITEAKPLTDYILSSMQIQDAEGYRDRLQAYLEEVLASRGGVIEIPKQSVMFIAG